MYLSWRRRFDDWLTVLTISRETACRLGVPPGEGRALGNLGTALRDVRRFDEAITAHQDAAAIHRETGDGLALTRPGGRNLVLRRVTDDHILEHLTREW
jgi:hypothetical protein